MLPRTLQVWKDLEEPGRDKLFLAALKEKVEQASVAKVDRQLSADEFRALDSKGQIFLQAADLCVSSRNRVLNAEGKRTGPKDQFADYFLERLGLPEGPRGAEEFSDMTIHVSL